MYSFCVENELPLLWAYLWSSWYKQTRWNLWARSTCITIPLGKTNMMIEAHWKVLKYTYLYRFNRPRLDYLMWILCSRVLHDQLIRFHQMQQGRLAPSWFEPFKKEWNKLAAKTIANEVEERHTTDLKRWVCSCPSFLCSRFLICKHLVQKAIGDAKAQGIRLVYTNFKRRTEYPFLI